MKRTVLVCLLFFCSLGNSLAFQKSKRHDQLVTISTSFGEMKLVLFDDTPLHKENFLKLIKEGFYDDLLFHRVIEGFMIQTGDSLSKNAPANQRLGRGSKPYMIPAEISPNRFHKKGAVAAARRGDRSNPERKSSGSQFYIVQGRVEKEAVLRATNYEVLNEALIKLSTQMPNHELNLKLRGVLENQGRAAYDSAVQENIGKLQAVTGMIIKIPEERIEAYTTIGGTPSLDDQYTVFGQVIYGLETIDSIAAARTDRYDRPIKDIKMTVSVARIKRKKITKLYGYRYE